MVYVQGKWHGYTVCVDKSCEHFSENVELFVVTP